MALGFGRKKAAGDAPATSVSVPTEVAPPQAAPVPAHAPASPPPDELDAFDLDSFAALPLAETPASPPQNVAAGDAGSAFDFPATPSTQVTPSSTAPIGAAGADPPDFDKLYEIEQANAARTSHAPAPFVPPSATIEEPATPFYEPQVPAPELEVPAPKKKFPLVPVLGALAILGAGGIVASMMRPAPEVDETAPIVPRPRVRPAPAATAGTVQQASIQGANVNSGMVKAGMPPKNNSAPGAVRPGIAPATDQLTQLKSLWNQGANAKHRGDRAAARRYWMQGLKMQPGNVGFQQSLAKLKK